MDAPLYHRMTQFAHKPKTPFYMPGHKGRGFDPLTDSLYPFDVTELPETDSLFCPEEVIKAAQEKAAQAFGAQASFFLTNGSTGGILAMLAYALTDGDTVLVDRSCHHSVISGLIHTGAQPVYLSPAYLPEHGIPGGLSPELLEEALRRYPRARAVVVTSPNYYGICSDITQLAAIAHRYGCLLLIDEAHGAHFAFSDQLPQTALSCGADIVVQSMHKTLPAPNQSALLHAGKGIDVQRLKRCINLFQTTSPSYPIMACMDAARALGEQWGKGQTKLLLQRLEPIRGYAADLPPRGASYCNIDPWKLLLRDSTRSGYELAEQLMQEGVYPELSDRNHCLLMCSWSTSQEDIDGLLSALHRIGYRRAVRCAAVPLLAAAPILQPAHPPRMAFSAPSQWISLDQAAGRISKNAVTAFPPCIPIVLCGERIRAAHIEQLEQLSDAQVRIQGIVDGRIEVLDK